MALCSFSSIHSNIHSYVKSLPPLPSLTGTGTYSLTTTNPNYYQYTFTNGTGGISITNLNTTGFTLNYFVVGGGGAGGGNEGGGGEVEVY